VKRFLLALILFGAVMMILRRLAGAFVPARTKAAPPRGDELRRGSTELVRDRVCNTFLPKDRAIALEEAGQVHYFCSEACRSRHRSGAPRATDAA
jgi:YHS domain-containing protein